jgi:two-component system sensor histidine kinase KdpD
MNLVILPPSKPTDRRRRAGPLLAYVVSLALVAAATLAAVIVGQVVRTPTSLALFFVLPVVIAAVTYGFGPSLAAAVAGVTAYNFFLLPPLYTLNVADPANVWALFLLLAVAAIVSLVAGHSRRRAVEAWQAADQANALQGFARTLVATSGRTGVAKAAADALGRLFTASAVVLLQEGDSLKVAARVGLGRLSKADEEAAAWALASRLRTHADAYPVEAATYDFWPIVSPQRQQAVIGVAIAGREGGRPEAPEKLVEAVGAYLAVALDREAYAAQVADSRVEVEKERLKTDLLAAVSHDLKTPLSTVLFTLQSLKTFGAKHDAKTRKDLLALAETETARLSAMVGNLLDMNRLDAGAVVVHKAPAPPADLVVEALQRAQGALAGRKVVNEVGAAQPPLLADATLFETALANVLENAGKYAPSGSTIRIRSGADDETGWIEVTDEGPGFAGDIEPMFEKFSRGVAGDGRPPGTGLGLAIARGFLEAQGGAVEAENLPDGKGARVRLSAPLAQAA